MPDPTLRELIIPIVHELLAQERDIPLMVSQRNCEAVLGIPSRIHLENCRRSDFTPRVLKLGKLRLVDVQEYRAWLRVQAVTSCQRAADEEADGASQVLREIGLFSRANRTKHTSLPTLTTDRRRPTVG